MTWKEQCTMVSAIPWPSLMSKKIKKIIFRCRQCSGQHQCVFFYPYFVQYILYLVLKKFMSCSSWPTPIFNFFFNFLVPVLKWSTPIFNKKYIFLILWTHWPTTIHMGIIQEFVGVSIWKSNVDMFCLDKKVVQPG